MKFVWGMQALQVFPVSVELTLRGQLHHRNNSQHLPPSLARTLLVMPDITKVDGRIDFFNIYEK